MRLIRPVDAEVVAHSPSSFFWRRGRGAGTAGWPYTGPPGDHFLLNLWRRSLADRDSLLRSLRGLGAPRSSGQQAPSPHACLPSPTLRPFPAQERVTLPCTTRTGLSIRCARSATAALGWRTRYLETVAYAISKAQLLEFPVNPRRAPQGVSPATFVGSALGPPAPTAGRPGPFRRLFRAQKSWKAVRCYRITVAGWTTEMAIHPTGPPAGQQDPDKMKRLAIP